MENGSHVIATKVMAIFETALKEYWDPKNPSEQVLKISQFLYTELNEKNFGVNKEKVWDACFSALNTLNVEINSKEELLNTFEKNLKMKLYHKFVYNPVSMFAKKESDLNINKLIEEENLDVFDEHLNGEINTIPEFPKVNKP